MASGRQVIPLIQGLKKTVEAGLHLDSLFPDPKDFYPPPEGIEPLFSVSYDELDLNGIEAAFQLAKDKVLPLRNFFVGKQKGQSKNKSLLSFYCGINRKNEIIYFLIVESILAQKLKLALSSPELSVKMRITGLDQEHVEQIKGIFFFPSLMKFKPACGRYAITKHALEKVARFPGQNLIIFQLTVDIECLGAEATNVPLKIHPTLSLSKLYYLPDSSKDVTIVASNKAEIKAHRNILMAQSSAFLSMFSPETAMSEAKSGRIFLEQNSAEGLTMFIRSLYGFEVPIGNISPDLALELFQLSHKYNVQEIELAMKNFLTKKDVEWYNVDSLLELYYFAKNLPCFEDVAEHALIEISKLSKQSLISSDYFKSLEVEDQRDLVLELLDWK